jgi:hypothetical protein
MPTLTLGAASRLTGCAKSTLLRAIRAGRMSANRDDTGQWQIEPVELFRVFPSIPPEATLAPATVEHGAIADEITAPAAVEHGAIAGEITDELVKLLREQLEDMRNQVADLCADRDYWRQASDHWRVEFETTRRPLPVPEQLEDMRNQVADLCTDSNYWRQASDHWRVAFETTQRLPPAPVEQGTTIVTNWRMVFGQLCSMWAAQLATAVVSWRGVFGRLWSTWAAQLARQREHWLGERRGRPVRHCPAHGYWQRGLGKDDAGDDREMPSYLFGHRGHA